jgi:hypothetical protein
MFARILLWGLTGLAALTLAACGGGSSAAPSFLTITGSAATGAPAANAAVSVTCVTGTGSATTLPNGSYTVTVVNGTGPCVITVTSGTTVLTSITPPIAAGTSAVANVTPLTTAIVQALLVAKGDSATASPTDLATAKYAPTATDLTNAVASTITAVNAALPTGAPKLAAGTDLLAGAYNPTSSSDPVDQVLVALTTNNLTTSTGQLVATVQSQVTTQVQATVKANSGTGSTGATS